MEFHGRFSSLPLETSLGEWPDRALFRPYSGGSSNHRSIALRNNHIGKLSYHPVSEFFFHGIVALRRTISGMNRRNIYAHDSGVVATCLPLYFAAVPFLSAGSCVSMRQHGIRIASPMLDISIRIPRTRPTSSSPLFNCKLKTQRCPRYATIKSIIRPLRGFSLNGRVVQFVHRAVQIN
jgi:hypothetical protein